MTLPFHPLANLFPLIEGVEFDELVADVKAHGLRERIVILDGMILDGRNRYRACEAARVEPEFVQARADVDPLALVISANLRRRHLRESQRALVGARIAQLGQGRPSTVRGHRVPTAAEAAQVLGVSERAIGMARRVLKQARAELVAMVETGRVSVRAAEAASRLPSSEQERVVAQGPRAVVAAAHVTAAGGTRGRREFADLWARFDAIAEALKAGALGDAGLAAHKLANAIDALAAARREKHDA